MSVMLYFPCRYSSDVENIGLEEVELRRIKEKL